MVGSVGELYGVPVLTVGLDLAAEPAGTALAAIEWSSGWARLVRVDVGVDDDAVVDAIAAADKAGIDARWDGRRRSWSSSAPITPARWTHRAI